MANKDKADQLAEELAQARTRLIAGIREVRSYTQPASVAARGLRRVGDLIFAATQFGRRG